MLSFNVGEMPESHHRLHWSELRLSEMCVEKDGYKIIETSQNS